MRVMLLLVSLSLHAANLMTYTDVSGSSRTNEPVQFGRVFIQGEIANYPQVKVGASAVTTQANVLSRWADGSVKHAVVSFLLPSVAGNGSAALTFQNQATCNCGSGARLTRAQMLDAAYNFDATVTVGATTISARTILSDWDGSTTGATGPVQYWNDGSISTTVILADHSTGRAYDITVNGFPSLRPIFIATFWPTINKVKVRYVLENSNTQSIQDITYTAVLAAGSSSPSTVYNSASTWASGIPHKAGARWTKTAWIGGAPDERYNLNHNVGYLASALAVPNYDPSKTVSVSQIATDHSAWTAGTKDIFQTHGANAYTWCSSMGTAGGRPDIGPMPAWYAKWLYTGDYRERAITLGNADLAASWGVHIREGASGKFFDAAGTVPALGHPVSIYARPSVDFSQGWLQPSASVGDKINTVGSATSPLALGAWSWDAAHLPAAYYVPYLLTGDFYYLEEQWFWNSFSSIYSVASTSVNYGRGPTLTTGGVYTGQMRAFAWGIRERAELAWISPDSLPETGLFTAQLADIIAVNDGVVNRTDSAYYGDARWTWGRTVKATNSRYTLGGSGTPNPSGLFWAGFDGFDGACQGGYGINTATCYRHDSTFELAYLTYSLGRARELGFPTDPMLKAIAPWYKRIITDPDFNPYLLQVGRGVVTLKSAPSTYVTTATEIMSSYWQTAADAVAAGAVSNGVTIWKGVTQFQLADPDNGYEYLGTASVAALYPVLDASDQSAMWGWVNNHVFQASSYGNNPKWAILPRGWTPPQCSITPTGGVYTVGDPVHITATISDCSASTWSASGLWPPGVTFSGGVASGTATTAGTYAPTVTYGPASATLTIIVRNPPAGLRGVSMRGATIR